MACYIDPSMIAASHSQAIHGVVILCKIVTHKVLALWLVLEIMEYAGFACGGFLPRFCEKVSSMHWCECTGVHDLPFVLG